MSKKTVKAQTLESSLSEIDKLISKMEEDELTLDESLEQFERGITLIKHCQQTLAKAEQKVEILLEKNKKESLALFDEEEDEADDIE